MAGSITATNRCSKDSSPLRLSPRTVTLHKRSARLPPLEVKEKKNLLNKGRKSSMPPAPPPTPVPWSWYHRDCMLPTTNAAPRSKRVATVRNGDQSPLTDTRNNRTISAALPALTERVGSFPEVQVELIKDHFPVGTKADLKTKGDSESEIELYPETHPTSALLSTSVQILQGCRLSAFLLQVAQAVFEEMISLELLIKKILEVAQGLVNADRASLFLVDSNNSELVSTVFDLKHEVERDNNLQKQEIRIPLNKGIAGYVASQGVTLNISDAYADARFNKAIDDVTGYRTTTILCMPIKVQGQVVAVVQMVNKRDRKTFDKEDETSFEVFSTLFGLALHHARLYDQMIKNEQKYKIALDVLSYHNKCDEIEVIRLLKERELIEKETIIFNDFALNPYELSDQEKCRGFIHMFEDLFDISQFDVRDLGRFVLTVKKNYRRVPYHNFDHGWTVANAVYTILKTDTMNRFDYKSRLALFVACLCHDLDHRGYTNRFMSDIGSPLASMYTTSTLEHHHFNITVIILQQEGHNILARLSTEDYKEVLDMIRQCILATDLAVFFPNLEKINQLIFIAKNYNWENESHRALGRGILMTSADLSAAAKPFPIQWKTAAIIQEEFFHQGDLEKRAGREPIAMMDRDKPDEQPNNQVKFLSEICLPCYRVLYSLLPMTKVMYENTVDNINSWKFRAIATAELRKKHRHDARTLSITKNFLD